MPARKFDWDVVIVAAGDAASNHAHRLRRELEDHRLLVKLNLVPVPSVSPMPHEILDDAKRGRHSVILMAVKGSTTGSQSIAYVSAPAPKREGELPVFGAVGSDAAAKGIETGRLGEDVVGLAARIATRINK